MDCLFSRLPVPALPRDVHDKRPPSSVLPPGAGSSSHVVSNPSLPCTLLTPPPPPCTRTPWSPVPSIRSLFSSRPLCVAAAKGSAVSAARRPSRTTLRPIRRACISASTSCFRACTLLAFSAYSAPSLCDFGGFSRAAICIDVPLASCRPETCATCSGLSTAPRSLRARSSAPVSEALKVSSPRVPVPSSARARGSSMLRGASAPK